MTSQMLEIYTKLNKKQQDLLNYARTHQICQHVEYESGRYIGIDASYNPKLKIEEEDGLWSIGIVFDTNRETIPEKGHSGPNSGNDSSSH